MIFQSTRPVWGATLAPYLPYSQVGHFNPRAPCGARRHKSFSPFRQCPISIHAPRVGRDGNAWTRQKRSAPDFNPRAPCGARPNRPRGRGRLYQFQSTRPVWGATASAVGCKPVTIISIHAPRVGRDGTVTTIYDLAADISIHAPRVGRDAGYTAILISA